MSKQIDKTLPLTNRSVVETLRASRKPLVLHASLSQNPGITPYVFTAGMGEILFCGDLLASADIPEGEKLIDLTGPEYSEFRVGPGSEEQTVPVNASSTVTTIFIIKNDGIYATADISSTEILRLNSLRYFLDVVVD